MTATLPAALAEIREEFLELPEPDRLQLLLEFSGELPPVPDEYRDHPELSERVVECQSPVYIIVDVADAEHMVAGDNNDAFTRSILPFLHDVRAGSAPVHAGV